MEYIIGITILIVCLGFFLDKLMKPKRIKENFLFTTCVILLSRAKTDNNFYDNPTDLLSKIHYVITHFYPDSWTLMKEGILDIKSKDIREKLELEFSKIHEILNKKDNTPEADSVLPDQQLVRRKFTDLNIKFEILEKDEKDWPLDYKLFWGYITTVIASRF
tara:strand:- start:2162 stop:2647 length:486 start_codon:yes stop_codon:yes gene_type:complete